MDYEGFAAHDSDTNQTSTGNATSMSHLMLETNAIVLIYILRAYRGML